MTTRVPSRPAPALTAALRELPAAAPLLERLPSDVPVAVVGGAVRDLLRGTVPLDLDLVVEGDAAALAARLGATGVRHHPRFGTATARIGARSYDLATARRERYRRPGELPEVAPASLEEDLARRDFTVNALALRLTGPQAGWLVARPDAEADLAAGRLRILHPASFSDDPTRLYRLVRYGARLGFTAEPQTDAAARAAVRAGVLATVSGERIGQELGLLAAEDTRLGALTSAGELGLLEPLAGPGARFDARLAAGALALLPEGERADLLVLAAAALPGASGAPGAGGPGALGARLDALGFTSAERVAIAAAGAAARTAADLRTARSPSEIAATLRGSPATLAALAGAVDPEAEPAVRAWFGGLRDVALAIGGDDLIAAGVPRGPAVGRGLRAALAAKLDGRADGRESELAAALAAAGDSP